MLHPFTCPAGCKAGKQIVAQDPTKLSFCSVGSAFYCCDAPDEEPDDDESNLNFCTSSDGDYPLSISSTKGDNYDDDGNPADIVELYWFVEDALPVILPIANDRMFRYENDVFVAPNTASPDDEKRGLSIIDQLNALRLDRRWDRPTDINNRTLDQVCISAWDCFNILEPDLPEVQALMNEIRLTWEHTGVVRAHEDEVSALAERAPRGATVKFKNNRRTRYTASTYQNVAQLASLGRQFYANQVAKAAAGQVAVCLKNAGTFAGRQLSREFAPSCLYGGKYGRS